MGRGEKTKRAAGAGWMWRSPHAWRHPRIFFCCPGALGIGGRRMLSPVSDAPRWFGGAAQLHPSRLSPQQLPAIPQHPGDPWMRPHGRTAPGGARGARMSPGWGHREVSQPSSRGHQPFLQELRGPEEGGSSSRGASRALSATAGGSHGVRSSAHGAGEQCGVCERC